MNKFLISLLLLFISQTVVAFGQGDEFYIVTDAPIAVGGGMIRYYIHTDDGRKAMRFSYRGIVDDSLYIEKTTRSKGTGTASERELIKLPLSRKGVKYEIGDHLVKLKINKYGRVLVKELSK